MPPTFPAKARATSGGASPASSNGGRTTPRPSNAPSRSEWMAGTGGGITRARRES